MLLTTYTAGNDQIFLDYYGEWPVRAMLGGFASRASMSTKRIEVDSDASDTELVGSETDGEVSVCLPPFSLRILIFTILVACQSLDCAESSPFGSRAGIPFSEPLAAPSGPSTSASRLLIQQDLVISVDETKGMAQAQSSVHRLDDGNEEDVITRNNTPTRKANQRIRGEECSCYTRA
jgi:hypothetical protein